MALLKTPLAILLAFASAIASHAQDPQGAAPPKQEAPATPPKAAAEASQPKPKEQPKTYKVKVGDKLSDISKATGVSYADLVRWNRIDDPNVVVVGRVLYLENPGPSKAGASTAKAEAPAPSKRVKKAKKGPESTPAALDPDVIEKIVEKALERRDQAERKITKPAEPAEAEDEGGNRVSRVNVKKTPESTVVVIRETAQTRDIRWRPNAIPSVNIDQKIALTIFLPDKEQIIQGVAGDTEEFHITPSVGHNVCVIKATADDRMTNLVLFCQSGNTYNFTITCDSTLPWIQILRVFPPATESSSVLVPGGGMNFGTLDGEEEAQGPKQAAIPGLPAGRDGKIDPAIAQEAIERARNEERDRFETEKREFIQAMLANRNDQFKVTYDWGCKLRVTNAFSASNTTYIRVESPLNQQAMFWVIGDEGKEELVHWQVSKYDPNVIMVDRVFERGRIAIGKKAAHLTNLGLKKEMDRIKHLSWFGHDSMQIEELRTIQGHQDGWRLPDAA